MTQNLQPIVPLSGIPTYGYFQFVTTTGLAHPDDVSFVKLGTNPDGYTIICQVDLPQTDEYIQVIDSDSPVIHIGHN